MAALDGITVLSFNHFLSGPAAAQFLGDIGANVIAVEPLTGAFQRNWAVGNRYVDDTSVNHLTTGRNKRSLAIDLKSPEGLAAVRRLIAKADVVMENFRPGTLDKLGLSEAEMREINPKLIYATTTGFGVDGPYRNRPGQDILLQAMTGLAAHTGSMESGPVAVGTVPIDHHTAALTVTGIVAALFQRERTGKGSRVDVNMLQAAMDLQGESITAWVNGAERRGPRGEAGMANCFAPAPYGVYAVKDGYIMISMCKPADFAEILELPQLASMTERDGFDRRAEISTAVAGAMALLTKEEALERLASKGIWHEPISDYDDLRANPQAQHLGAFIEAKGQAGSPVTLVAHPVRYDGKQPEVRYMPQPLGAQTTEILNEMGFDEAEIAQLLACGAVAQTNKMRS